ncbi:acinetodin/klebsidin/J25 family lasso peptide [Pseudomonas batumici]|uniref:acinetodin/klebsidin/J25 family lasso peptide n=1 Tax=Pseudomonas batumici TaxID=226910 RepID=UPI0030D25F79
MENMTNEKAFTAQDIGELRVITMNQSASKITQGGDGPISEYFNAFRINADWQAQDFYG